MLLEPYNVYCDIITPSMEGRCLCLVWRVVACQRSQRLGLQPRTQSGSPRIVNNLFKRIRAGNHRLQGQFPWRLGVLCISLHLTQAIEGTHTISRNKQALPLTPVHNKEFLATYFYCFSISHASRYPAKARSRGEKPRPRSSLRSRLAPQGLTCEPPPPCTAHIIRIALWSRKQWRRQQCW